MMNLQRTWLRKRLRALCTVAVLTRPVTSFSISTRGSTSSSPLSHSLAQFQKLYSTTTNTEVDDDPLKWERMYQQKLRADDQVDSDFIDTGKVSSQVRVITFDLDDTIWKTGSTIASANEVLAAHLTSLGIEQPKRVEVVMGELFRADKKRYAPVQGEDAKSPVLLTLLRKDAIAYVATEFNHLPLSDAMPLADEAFEVWKKARHDAIPSHLAQSVRDCLEALARLQTADGNQVLIGAITDGNSDPALVSEIGSFFDFCINAEQVGVSKPHPDVYIRAVQHVKERWQQLGITTNLDELIDPLTWTVGPWWVHIGDDFVKDVVAAKDFRMRSIWSRELVLHKLPTAQTRDTTPGQSKTLEEFDKDISSQDIVRMQIGSDDYLRESLEREFADRIIDTFSELVPVLTEWHNDGLANALGKVALPVNTVSVVEDVESRRAEGNSRLEPPTGSSATKFCLFCGSKLPVNARFCSSCGENQE
jgi:FMN hydrolase / 5-amino-6-(5-phospho-D-ribitylamino)uracil phosphatase